MSLKTSDMKLIVSPDNFSCVAASLAMVTNISLDIVLEELFTDLPCPFPPPWDEIPKVPTTDEIAFWLWTEHFHGIMPFNRNPTCSINSECPPIKVWSDEETMWQRQLTFGWGLLEGATVNGGHLCAWDGSLVFDPRGYIYKWRDRLEYSFDAHRFWLLI